MDCTDREAVFVRYRQPDGATGNLQGGARCRVQRKAAGRAAQQHAERLAQCGANALSADGAVGAWRRGNADDAECGLR